MGGNTHASALMGTDSVESEVRNVCGKTVVRELQATVMQLHTHRIACCWQQLASLVQAPCLGPPGAPEVSAEILATVECIWRWCRVSPNPVLINCFGIMIHVGDVLLIHYIFDVILKLTVPELQFSDSYWSPRCCKTGESSEGFGRSWNVGGPNYELLLSADIWTFVKWTFVKWQAFIACQVHILLYIKFRTTLFTKQTLHQFTTCFNSYLSSFGYAEYCNKGFDAAKKYMKHVS